MVMNFDTQKENIFTLKDAICLYNGQPEDYDNNSSSGTCCYEPYANFDVFAFFLLLIIFLCNKVNEMKWLNKTKFFGKIAKAFKLILKYNLLFNTE